MKRIFIPALLCFLFSFSSVQAKELVKISFPGAENQEASLFAYEDLMNYQLKKLKQKSFDSKAQVRFELNVNHVQRFVVRVGFTRFSFYMEPGASYEIVVDTMNFDHPAMYPIQVVNYLTPHYTIKRTTKGEDVNALLNTFSDNYNEFLNRNYMRIYRKQDVAGVVDSAKLLIEQFTKQTEHEYVKVHANIQMGQLQMMARQLQPAKMAETYFTADKIQYRNLAYMDFFNMYWKGYILTRSKAFTPYELDSAVNIERSYARLDALVARDSVLADSTLRQLVILRNLQDMYVNRKFRKEAVQTILMNLAGQAAHPEHEKMATHMRKIFHKYEKGNTAPDFSVVSFEGSTLRLEEMKGKYVVISFFNMQCLECLAELDYMVELYEEFHDIIEFVSVSTDQDPAKAKQYVTAKDYKWTFAFYNHDLFDNYNISMIPVFILIDKEGKMENYDCPRPSQYFEDYFIQMLNEKKGNLD